MYYLFKKYVKYKTEATICGHLGNKVQNDRYMFIKTSIILMLIFIKYLLCACDCFKLFHTCVNELSELNIFSLLK